MPKDRNDLEVIINNQRTIMGAFVKFLKIEGVGKHEETIEYLNERLDYLTKRELERFG